MSGWGDRRDPEEEEGEEDALDEEYRSAEDHVLFLIDSRPSMFARSASGEAWIVNCLRVAQSVMKSKVVSSEKSCVGIFLFGAVRVATLLPCSCMVPHIHIHRKIS